ncbi:hypothetical protein OS493_014676 [Desmophyllum pertusum]|uniref:Rab-GAP TBC domain-containing protein n=1 Tax=Desmophyllum pertusum TaxID=174260 RepID=A0A9W9YG82_9CNID|nr:hypothetical protein OS493_014676 [Desmophyllum pertusum]
MAFKQRVSEFKSALSVQQIDLKHLKRLCFSGIPDGSGIRSICWKLLLGYLPPQKDLWPETLKRQRSTYKQFVEEIIIEQCRGTKSGKESKEFDVDHPLNPNPDSQWLAFFKDNEEVMSRYFFFQIATKYPNKKVTTGDDRDFETLRERVLRTHLEASHVNTNRSGLKNLSAPRKIAPEEYFVLGDSQEAHWEVVERILYIYAKLNPGLGYVQGMNEIIGPLYYVFSSDPNTEWQENVEADVFFCFTSLMSEIRDNFIKSLDDSACGIGNMMKSVRTLLRERDLMLFTYLEEQQMRPQFYSFRWLTLLLSQEFALPDVIRVWDSLFADEKRFDFLIYVCCAMHTVIRDQLLAGDFATTMKLLQNYPDIDIHIILSRAIELKRPRVVVPNPHRDRRRDDRQQLFHDHLCHRQIQKLTTD